MSESSVDLASPEPQLSGGERTRLRLVTVNLAMVNLVMCVNFAILAPFYPKEAGDKGVSTAVIGFIFGEFELIIFLTAPVFGILLPRVGAKFMYLSGIFLCGGCSILFGFLQDCPSGGTFIVMSLLVRGVMAVGASMLVTASFAIIAASFPSNVTTMFGLLETFSGIGLMLGPPLGGALYELGGFQLPFIVMGVLMLLVIPVTVCILRFDSDALPSRTGSFLSIMSNPHAIVVALLMWCTAMTIGFLDPILQPFLSGNFGLNELLVGLVFLCGPATYAFLSPIVGCICDKWPVTKQLMALSLFVLGLSMLFISPSPLFKFGAKRLWLTIVASFVFGIGVGLGLVPCTKDILNECLIMGFEDNFGTFSLVSGFINSFLSLGFFSGPILSGLLTDKYGFDWSTTALGFFLILIGVLYTLYFFIFMYCMGGRRRERRETALSPEEQEPLINPSI